MSVFAELTADETTHRPPQSRLCLTAELFRAFNSTAYWRSARSPSQMSLLEGAASAVADELDTDAEAPERENADLAVLGVVESPADAAKRPVDRRRADPLVRDPQVDLEHPVGNTDWPITTMGRRSSPGFALIVP